MTKSTEINRRIERQAETATLHRSIGAAGLGRLRHPLRNLQAIATVAKRQTAGEYDPSKVSMGVGEPVVPLKFEEMTDAERIRWHVRNAGGSDQLSRSDEPSTENHITQK